MSREIKFRAWIFGGLDKYAAPFMETITALVWDSDGLTIKWTRWEEISCPGEFRLMQYTGLKDKNGKEIYEGDVVMLHSKDAPYAKARAVEFSPDRGWGLPKKEQYTEPTNGCVWWAQFEYEVIGNIYENPELLEAAHV